MNKLLKVLKAQLFTPKENFNVVEAIKKNVSGIAKQQELIELYHQTIIRLGYFSGNAFAPLLPLDVHNKDSSGVKFTKAYAAKKYHQRNGTTWSGSTYGTRNAFVLRYFINNLELVKSEQSNRPVKAIALCVLFVVGVTVCSLVL